MLCTGSFVRMIRHLAPINQPIHNNNNNNNNNNDITKIIIIINYNNNYNYMKLFIHEMN